MWGRWRVITNTCISQHNSCADSKMSTALSSNSSSTGLGAVVAETKRCQCPSRAFLGSISVRTLDELGAKSSWSRRRCGRWSPRHSTMPCRHGLRPIWTESIVAFALRKHHHSYYIVVQEKQSVSYLKVLYQQTTRTQHIGYLYLFHPGS